MSKKMERRKERELGLWGIFRLDFGEGEEPISEILAELPEEVKEGELDTISGDYANEIVQVYQKNAEEVDGFIEKNLRDGWNMKKIAKTEKAILRLAITEMLMMENPVPKEIAINEAVELTKKYGGENSTRYINGILNKVARDNNLADNVKSEIRRGNKKDVDGD